MRRTDRPQRWHAKGATATTNKKERKKEKRRDVQTMWCYEYDGMTLTFHCDFRSYASWYFVRVPSANFVVWRLWLMQVVVLHPYTKFEIRIGLAWWPWPLTSELTSIFKVKGGSPLTSELTSIFAAWWPTFDFKNGMRVASRWGNFLPNLGTLHLWVLELFAMYASTRRTDRQKQHLLSLPCGQGHDNRFKYFRYLSVKRDRGPCPTRWHR